MAEHQRKEQKHLQNVQQIKQAAEARLEASIVKHRAAQQKQNELQFTSVVAQKIELEK